jgi:hypothetical protein
VLEVLAKLQLAGAFLVGILLLTVPLYLWRRPRAVQKPAQATAGAVDPPRDAGAAASAVPAPVPEAAPPPLPVRLAEPRILECHDPGATHTPPEQCDHIPAFEKAFADAIEASHDCVPGEAGMGSIEYVADLSFGRKNNPILVQLPQNGRSYKNSRIVATCAAGVRNRLTTLPLGALAHGHTRYKVALIASYPGLAPASGPGP